jgi:ADP-heptose:LPS heptosyltransferase
VKTYRQILNGVIQRTKENGLVSILRSVVKKPRGVWQVLCAFPKLFVQCVCLRKSILWVYRHAGIGDIVSTLPSVATLKQHFPKMIVVYETRPGYVTLVRRCPHVDMVIEDCSLPTKFLPRIFKPKMSFRPLLPEERHPPQPRERIHIIEEFQKSFGLKSLNEQSARLTVSSRALRQVGRRLRHEQMGGKPFAVIHTGPTWKVKEWPEKNWDDLVAGLKARNQIAIIQIGENRTATGEARESPHVVGAINWVGTLTMDQTLALLSLANLFVGVDSGVLHLAGVMDAPCVGIFGPTDPMCFLPRNGRSAGMVSNVSCLGCHHDPQGPRHWQSGCANHIRCMTELSVESVSEACGKLLRSRQPGVVPEKRASIN